MPVTPAPAPALFGTAHLSATETTTDAAVAAAVRLVTMQLPKPPMEPATIRGEWIGYEPEHQARVVYVDLPLWAVRADHDAFHARSLSVGHPLCARCASGEEPRPGTVAVAITTAAERVAALPRDLDGTPYRTDEIGPWKVTPCCGAYAKGMQDGVGCRSCYGDVEYLGDGYYDGPARLA